MTESLRHEYMPTLDEAMRFAKSNPQVTWTIITEVLGLGNEDKAAVSGGRFRELWKLSGGMIDKTGKAWIEVDLLPNVLRQILDAINKLPPDRAPGEVK